MSDKETPWQKWNRAMGETRPWDLLNPNTEYLPEEESSNRFSICKQCPKLIKATGQCKECGCFMSLKTKLVKAECPLHKW